jgi:serine O-acetyltransferase
MNDTLRTSRPSHDAPVARGERNDNPPGIGLRALIAEDFRTHDRNPFEAGFWAVALHRLGNARMAIRPRALRAPFSAFYKVAFLFIDWFLGIELPYTVRLGRRVRIWHHGGIVLSARSIGDDVHIRHNTTFGLAHRSQPEGLPIIGDRVDIGVGTCVLGAVTIGEDCVIGAGSIVVRDLEPGTTAVGAPARPIRRPERPERREKRASSTSGFRFRTVPGGFNAGAK